VSRSRRRKGTRSSSVVNPSRLLVLAGVVVLGYGGLLARAVQLQAIDSEWLAGRASAQHNRTVRLDPLRGELHDRNGEPLAVSADVESIAASPRRVREPRKTARRLARALGSEAQRIERRLRSEGNFVWVDRWVEPEVADRIRELGLEGISLHPERKRFYPNRSLASAYLGFAGHDGVGLSGLEFAYEETLRGHQASFTTRRDARGGMILNTRGPLSGRTGATVVLTLDASLQHVAERRLAEAVQTSGALGGTLVALDPHTGDLLAVAQAPSFNPNRFWKEDPATFRARAFVDPFEPGSTLKPFVAALALEAGVVTPTDTFDCEQGRYRVLDRNIRDHHPYGVLSVSDIVRLSSNIGMAKVSDRLGSAELVAGLRRLGFGSGTDSGFPGEAPGRVRDIREAQAVERANLAFGQGMTSTAIQLATAGAVLANGGYRVRPRLTRGIWVDGQWLESEGGRGERLLAATAASQVMRMLEAVVSDGTGKSAALRGYRVAGKTGTAQKVVDGSYSQERYTASFLGIVPAGAPRLVMVVVLDEPRHAITGEHTGGGSAAPVFRQVAGFALQRLAQDPT